MKIETPFVKKEIFFFFLNLEIATVLGVLWFFGVVELGIEMGIV